ncbi:unnamed protein product [Acanthoscelides obtectus]|uniref:Uncharacterized protein n=1 Tax=Acanthoscelides obtectus TaxID=200917 RepID=A0A9P0JUU6_ACAOB|nr:unnamed protein product [Acanthoscelides obtectus]CAK1640748.1 hypothetical protein AOBTE_LOCUS11910 [Acanthoscelides obtectus]
MLKNKKNKIKKSGQQYKRVQRETSEKISEDVQASKIEPIKCSSCNEDLISDIEDDYEKNIGCDECPRLWNVI